MLINITITINISITILMLTHSLTAEPDVELGVQSQSTKLKQ